MENSVVTAVRAKITEIIKPYQNPANPPKTTGYLSPFQLVYPHKELDSKAAQTRAYYGFNYPQYPFLTEGDVEDLCKRFGLFVGYLPQYRGTIPPENQLEIEVFERNHFREVDKIGELPLLLDNFHLYSAYEILQETTGTDATLAALESMGNSTFRELIGYGSRTDHMVSFQSAGFMGAEYVRLAENLYIFTQIEKQTIPVPHILGGCPIVQSTPNIYMGLQCPNFRAIRSGDDLKYYLYDQANLGGSIENLVYGLYKEGRNVPVAENLVYVKVPTRNNWEIMTNRTEGYSVTTVNMQLSGLEYGLREILANVFSGNLLKNTPSLKIIAPLDEFMGGLQQTQGYNLRFSDNPVFDGKPGEDPIVLQPVPYGYLMLTQWGDDIPKGSVQNAGAN